MKQLPTSRRRILPSCGSELQHKYEGRSFRTNSLTSSDTIEQQRNPGNRAGLPADSMVWLWTRRYRCHIHGHVGTFLILFQHSLHSTIQKVLLAHTVDENINVKLAPTCYKGGFRWVRSYYWVRAQKDGRFCTCGTIRCGLLLHIFLSSGCRQGFSWPGHIHSASVHLRSAHARSCQSHQLREENEVK